MSSRVRHFKVLRRKAFQARQQPNMNIDTALACEEKCDLLYQKMNEWEKEEAEAAENAMLEHYVYGGGDE